MADAFDSPDTVQLKGKVKGVTRLSRRAKAVVVMCGVGLLGFLVFSILGVDEEADAPAVSEQGEDQAKGTETAKPAVIPATPNFDNVGDGQASLAVNEAAAGGPAPQGTPPMSGGGAGSVQGGQNIGPAYNVGPDKMPPLTNKAVPAGTPNLAGNAATGASDMAGQPPAPRQPTQRELEAQQLERELADRKRAAVRAPMESQASEGMPAALGNSTAMSALATQQEALLKAAGQLGKQSGGLPGLGLSLGGMGAGATLQQDDPNRQQRKEQFLKSAGESSGKGYLAEGVEVPLSPFELKTGWAIPAKLQTGVNSDLPGEFIARVTENVCDTATGKHLLIPQHTMFTGTYDSQIAYGQERILAVASRMVFPDGSAINLGGMATGDRAGNAGFDADVNNHYGKVFGSAAFMATFSAGVSLTQKQNVLANGQQTNSQVIAQSLGQQLGQTGTAFIQRGMNVQPTLTRTPGYKFNIMVTKDIVFPGAYRGRSCR